MPDVANAGLYGAGANLPTDPGAGFDGVDMPPIGPSDIPPGPVIAFGPNPYPISGAGGYGNGYGSGYNPSSIMQMYMDFYANNPSAGGATSPAPGTGAAQEPPQSIISRLVGNIPAVRLAKLIGKVFTPNQKWQDNAKSNPGSWQGPPSIPGGGAIFGYNPAQGGGTPHFDPATGRVTATPSLNPLYTTGGDWQSVANAPQDVRFSQNSGTGNYTADMATKNFQLAGGYAGAPNRAGAPEEGRNRFDPSSGYVGRIIDGILTRVPSGYDQSKAFHPTQNMSGPALTVGNADEHNAWLMQQPEYLAWQKANGIQPQTIQDLIAKLIPRTTISGPPRLPIGA